MDKIQYKASNVHRALKTLEQFTKFHLYNIFYPDIVKFILKSYNQPKFNSLFWELFIYHLLKNVNWFGLILMYETEFLHLANKFYRFWIPSRRGEMGKVWSRPNILQWRIWIFLKSPSFPLSEKTGGRLCGSTGRIILSGGAGETRQGVGGSLSGVRVGGGKGITEGWGAITRQGEGHGGRGNSLRGWEWG